MFRTFNSSRDARRRLAVLAATALAVGTTAALVPSSGASAATVTVCASGCAHTSIASAVAAAAPGDTVTVAAGTYNETAQILINKPLTLQGAGNGATVITSTTTSTGVIRVQTQDVGTFGGEITIEGIRVPTRGGSGAHHTGVFVLSAAATPGPVVFDDVDIVGKNSPSSNESGLYLNGVANLHEPSVTFRNGSISGTAGNGLLGEDWRGGATFEDSTFTQLTTTSGPVLYHHMVNNPTAPGYVEQPRGAWNIEGNTITGQIGFRLFNTTVSEGHGPITISGNSITNNRLGGNAVQVSDRLGTSLSITDNVFDNTRNNASAILLDHTGTAVGALNATVTGNSFANFERGLFTGAGRTRNVSMTLNRFSNVTQGFNISTATVLDASSNWWGCNAGLSATPARCSERGGTGANGATVSNWIVASAAVAPTTVPVGGTATVDADLEHLNTGATVTLPAVFEGLATSYAAALGSVAPPTGTLTGGNAPTGTYAAPANGPAIDQVTATIDGEPVTLPVRIVPTGISGQITSTQTGQPVAGLQVRLYKDGDTKSAARTTDSNGFYSFANLGTGSYELWFRDVSTTQWVSEYYDEATTRAGSTPIAYTAGEALTIDEQLEPKAPVVAPARAAITGTVTSTEGGGPLAGIQVRLYSAVDGYVSSAAATTDANGAYAFPNRPAGTYKVWFRDVTATQFVSEYHSDKATLAAADAVVTNGSPVAIDAALDPVGSGPGPSTPGTISGTVTAPDGVTPIAGIQVRLYSATNGFATSTAVYTDATGSYSFPNRPEGTYKLWFRDVSNASWVSEYYEDASSLATATGFDVGPDGADIDAQLAPKNPPAG